MIDKALEALLKASKELDKQVPEELIKQVYQVEKDHLFDKEDDRDVPVRKIEKIIEEEISEE